MHERHKSGSIGIGVICSAIASVALGSTTNYTARSAFLAAVPPVSSITFITVAPNSILTNQFSALGVTFSEGDDRVVTEAGFVTDGIGVTGDAVSQNIDSITLQFSQPITAVGCDFPGALGIRLFSGATEVAYSGQFGSIGSGFFGGISSTVPFDRAVLTDPFAVDVYVDNLYFTAIPEPGFGTVLPALPLAMAVRRRVRPA